MEDGTMEHYRRELRRTAWRAAYRQRILYSRELPWLEKDEEPGPGQRRADEADRSVREFVDSIPFDKGKAVIEALFIEDKTEAEAAALLGISQQGVSKWKRKSLLYLRRMLSSSL
ncbi:sigma-70 family RNA polymerase sigma factor [Saccharibacillus sp. CPCC 101409]|uniref:sigma-70 family RNA polymerase sigma factor n=1 Tax=Saccharibacillus sp. CPCC 101409 TaxID=3058041 RepID=UPI0026727C62|nr:sigma-70 family RNA polymerase sigma factor [Saccharibacillus sp. CPCC 101409]MDO3408214.1 sigma-70 family RNA polymerase sigma factor [Saccharibacillus sp. CPCC 101409]